jgi:hypothetical protein
VASIPTSRVTDITSDFLEPAVYPLNLRKRIVQRNGALRHVALSICCGRSDVSPGSEAIVVSAACRPNDARIAAILLLLAGPHAKARRGRAPARPRYRRHNIWWETRGGFGGLPPFVIRRPALSV